MQALRQASAEVGIPCDRMNARAHLRDQLAVLPDLLPDESLRMGFDQLAQAAQQRSAAARRGLRPAAVIEGAPGCLNGGIHVGRRSFRNLAPLLFRARVAASERAFADTRSPLAIDQHAAGPLGGRPRAFALRL